jgi:uncharacterized protein YdiU (UPF0061 family)
MQQSTEKAKEIEENYSKIVEACRSEWQSWLHEYKAILVTQKQSDEQRKEAMDKVNPAFVLRNYLLEESIRKAENGDFTQVKELLRLAKKPYKDLENASYQAVPPEWAFELCVSCSS